MRSSLKRFEIGVPSNGVNRILDPIIEPSKAKYRS